MSIYQRFFLPLPSLLENLDLPNQLEIKRTAICAFLRIFGRLKSSVCFSIYDLIKYITYGIPGAQPASSISDLDKSWSYSLAK